MFTSDSVIPNIRRIIKQNGLKQVYVAEKAGYTEQMISDLLNGRRVVRTEDIVSLAAVLGVTPNDLFSTSSNAS